MTYKFYQSKKVMLWEATDFTVEADSYEEAVKKAEQARDQELNLCLGLMEGESETIYDGMEILSIEKNNGYSTIEVYSEDNGLLFENGKTNVQNQIR